MRPMRLKTPPPVKSKLFMAWYSLGSASVIPMRGMPASVKIFCVWMEL